MISCRFMIYQDRDIFVEWEKSEIPWVKIFTKKPYKEITEVPERLRSKLWKSYELTEKEMISFFRPCKINMASFGNYVPRVHIHVMARFDNDTFFPEPVWGRKQRQGSVECGDFEIFEKLLSRAFMEAFASVSRD